MKRMAALVLVLLLLTGCSADTQLDRVVSLRERLLNCEGVGFDVQITADYGEALYAFAMQCSVDSLGALSFTVTEPGTISGITGTVSGEGGKLTFDDQVLAFSLLADGQVTPVSAPWLLVRTLRSGYISACGTEGELTKVQIDDSYEENPLTLDIWLDTNDLPVQADILYEGRRVVSLSVSGFEIL